MTETALRIETLAVGPLQVNCYIVADAASGQAIVVDPGGDAGRIESALSEASLTPVAVVNTHGHFDHIGADDTVAIAHGIPVRIHVDDAEMLSHPSSANPIFGDEPIAAGRSPIKVLEHGEAIELGDVHIVVLHTPGHTPGGVCLAISAGGGPVTDIITGDTLFSGSVGRSDLPGGDTESLMASIRDRLMHFADDVRIHPGHGSSSTIGAQKEDNPYVMMLMRGGSW